MRLISTLMLMTIFTNSILCQAESLDSIDFTKIELFTPEYIYDKKEKLKAIIYTSNNQNLRMEQYYNAAGRIIQEQIYKDELVRDYKYTYLEKGEIIKRYDAIQNLELNPFISLNIRYPALAREEQIEGTVNVKLEFDENCVIIGFRIQNQLGYGIDKEVNKQMKRMVYFSKKYNIITKDCLELQKPFQLIFKLE